jgi:hypothetical protein
MERIAKVGKPVCITMKTPSPTHDIQKVTRGLKDDEKKKKTKLHIYCVFYNKEIKILIIVCEYNLRETKNL